MSRRFTLATGMVVLPLILAACVSHPPCAKKPDARMLKQPDQVFEYFKQSIDCEEYARAFDSLSPDAKRMVEYPVFSGMFSRFIVMKRLIHGAVLHRVEHKEGEPTAALTLCNNEFGLSQRFVLTRPLIVIWSIDLKPEQIEELKRVALDWFERQSELMGDRKYAIPSWWKYKSITIQPCEHMPGENKKKEHDQK